MTQPTLNKNYHYACVLHPLEIGVPQNSNMVSELVLVFAIFWRLANVKIITCGHELLLKNNNYINVSK